MSELLEKELVFKIIGSAMAVHRAIGHGFREKTYERGLCLDFKKNKITYSQQTSYPVIYLGEQIDEFIPDLIVEGRVIVDTKAITEITDYERAQMLLVFARHRNHSWFDH